MIGQAEEVAGSITDSDDQARTLAEVARALAAAGRHEDAGRVIGQAERVAGSITDSHDQARTLAEVARALAAAGRHEDAGRVIGQARASSRVDHRPVLPGAGLG